jgi:glucose-6-phosphate 1-dehydrogenase
VEITVAEDLGIGTRAGYYDATGALRDMVQNHLTQLLTLVAMEPPATFEADAIRNEKVKVLRSLAPIGPADVRLAQYGAGVIDGSDVPAYRDEEDVADDSRAPTYAGLVLRVDTWRWQGVPFYLRTGKRLPRRLTEIRVTFRRPPVCLFHGIDDDCEAHGNELVIRLQPDEGFTLLFDVKSPDDSVLLERHPFEFHYAEAFGELPDGYETLLLDILQGDQTLFVRADEVEESWRAYAPVLDLGVEPEMYPAGTWGPIAPDGRQYPGDS